MEKDIIKLKNIDFSKVKFSDELEKEIQRVANKKVTIVRVNGKIKIIKEKE